MSGPGSGKRENPSVDPGKPATNETGCYSALISLLSLAYFLASGGFTLMSKPHCLVSIVTSGVDVR
jgi:hypothetical protein